jgi:glycine C-acetyltransferase
MVEPLIADLRRQLDELLASGLYKHERILTTPQGAHINTPSVLNLCANNYLGLANDPGIIAAAHEALDRWGYGLSSVRFICGTQQIHKELEKKLSEFLGADDAILYSSCFDANCGLFETLLGPEDAVISDELNHASIIDGIRLCKAQRYRFRHADMADLESQLKASGNARHRLIATDGVFSMDGDIAKLPEICDLAEKYDALVMVDDSHAVGVLGANGRGSHEHHNVMGRVDIITGTLGKALGGASGGYTAGRTEIIELLRQRSRPYLFSNSVAPVIVATSLVALDKLAGARKRLMENTRYFRAKIGIPGEHPIVPVMLGDAKLAGRMADRLLEKGVYVIAFSYPVVPKDKARIRVQISAAHTRQDLDLAVEAFASVKKEMGI